MFHTRYLKLVLFMELWERLCHPRAINLKLPPELGILSFSQILSEIIPKLSRSLFCGSFWCTRRFFYFIIKKCICIVGKPSRIETFHEVAIVLWNPTCSHLWNSFCEFVSWISSACFYYPTQSTWFRFHRIFCCRKLSLNRWLWWSRIAQAMSVERMMRMHWNWAEVLQFIDLRSDYDPYHIIINMQFKL